jgi:hypothetical protein
MSEITILGGAVKVPEIFKVTEVIQPAKFKIVAPDGSEHEMVIDVKIYKGSDFYNSIEEFKKINPPQPKGE